MSGGEGGDNRSTGLLFEESDLTETEDDDETEAGTGGGPTAKVMVKAIKYGQRMDEILNESLQLTKDLMVRRGGAKRHEEALYSN